MSGRYAALVPCYNVGRACVPVLESTSRLVDLCVTIDDGSTDDTRACMDSVQAGNLQVLAHSRNQGKGAALVTGFRFLLERGFDAMLTLDGDGQHDPSLIPRFTSEYEANGQDLIIGNRMSDRRPMPLHRQWLNSLSNRTISRICRQPIEDSQCGFRLYSHELLARILDDVTSVRYELETEILIKASRLGMRVGFVPVSTIYSPETNSLSHHNFYDVLRIARLVTAHLIRR
jgi:glycosyltransferase involved in cell wall biosynthesis